MKEIFGSKEDLSNIGGSSPGGPTAAATTDAQGFLAIPGAAPGAAPGSAPGALSAAEGTLQAKNEVQPFLGTSWLGDQKCIDIFFCILARTRL